MHSSRRSVPLILNTALTLSNELVVCNNVARALRQGDVLRKGLQQHQHRLFSGAVASQSALLGLMQQLTAHPTLGLQTLRHYAAAAANAQPDPKQPKEQPAYDSLELTEEKISSITDKIPQRPVGVVEGASYTLVILAAFGVLAFVLYHVLTSLIFEPTAITCMNTALERLKSDPRITVRVGGADDIRAWGTNSESRVARQQIPHVIYKDANGVEHIRLQFNIRGPSGAGLVNADMYKDTSGQWQYLYLVVDTYPSSSSGAGPQRVAIVTAR